MLVGAAGPSLFDAWNNVKYILGGNVDFRKNCDFYCESSEFFLLNLTIGGLVFDLSCSAAYPAICFRYIFCKYHSKTLVLEVVGEKSNGAYKTSILLHVYIYKH